MPLKELYDSIKSNVSSSVWSKIKTPLYIIIGLLLIYGTVYLAAGREKPAHDNTALLQRIDSLQKIAITLQQDQLASLKNDVVFNNNITRLQRQIDSLRGMRYIIHTYYEKKSATIRGLEGKQIDSFFKQRYGY